MTDLVTSTRCPVDGGGSRVDDRVRAVRPCRVWVSALVVGLALLSGCADSDESAKTTRTRSPEVRIERGRVNAVDSAPPLGGSSFEQVAEVRSGLDRPTGAAVTAIDADGGYIETSFLRDAGSGFEGAHLVRANGSSGRLPLASRSRRGWTSASMNQRWIVWQESASADLSIDDWWMFAYDRKSKRAHRLARAPLLQGQKPPAPPGWTGPVVSADRVFWAQVGGSRDDPEVSLYGCRIARCEPRRIARDAAFPSATESSVVVLVGRNRSPSMATFDARTGELVRSLPVRLRPGHEVTGLAASDEHAVWTSSNGESHLASVVDLESKERWDFKIGAGGQFGYPVAGDGFVAWAEASGTGFYSVGGFVFEPRTERLRSLGNKAGLYDIKAAGKYLMWQDENKPSTTVYRVVRLK